MKTIKLASGFAVSALALAIAGQATAQTQTSVSFTGDIKVQTIIDFEKDQFVNRQPGLVAGNADWYNFVAAWTVTHGPFSGRIRAGIIEDNKSGLESRGGKGQAQVIVDNLIVTEGPVMFGQLTRVTDTAGLYESLTNQTVRNNLADETGDETTRFLIDAGVRYTVADAGLRMQLETRSDNTFGIAGALTQNLDVAQVWLDGQYHVKTEDTGMASNGSYNVGTAAQANLADPVVATGVFRSVTDAAGDNPRNVLAAQLQIAATEEVSIRGLITDENFSSAANTASARVGTTVSLSPFTIMADYEAPTANMGNAYLDGRVTWADGPLTAFVRGRYALNGFDADTVADAGRFTTGASLTSESGVVYGTEYNLTESGYLGGSAANTIELYASYSF